MISYNRLYSVVTIMFVMLLSGQIPAKAVEQELADGEATSEAIKIPEPPKYITYFEDNFEGDDLAEHWEIINPDPEYFIVENGVLTVLSSSKITIDSQDNLPNIFRLTKDLPSGDWKATIRFTPELSTLRENYSLGLYSDNENMLMGFLGNRLANGNIALNLTGIKISKGKKTSFNTLALAGSVHGFGGLHANFSNYANWVQNNERSVEFKIEKTGRSYVFSTRVEGDFTAANGTENEWVKLQKLTSLRSPGKSLVLAFNQSGGHPSYTIQGGESLTNIEWVKIEIKDNTPAVETAIEATTESATVE